MELSLGLRQPIKLRIVRTGINFLFVGSVGGGLGELRPATIVGKKHP